MQTIQIKKNHIKELIKLIIQVERSNASFFKQKSILDYIELQFKTSGFSIEFDKTLPDHLLEEIALIFQSLAKKNQ